MSNGGATFEMLLSRVIDGGSVGPLAQYAVTRDIAAADSDRAAYDFIVNYAAENGGLSPSYAAVTAAVDGFTYIPAVSDSYDYLVRELKDAHGKRQMAVLLGGDPEIQRKFTELSTADFVAWMTAKAQKISLDSTVHADVGVRLSAAHDRFMTEYRGRAAGESMRIWASKFPTINSEIGGYFSSNLYVWYARSGRGKSVITMEEAIEAAFQGAVVLVWAMEMTEFEWFARAYTSISARLGVTTAQIDGTDYAAGFNNGDIRKASLPPEFLAEFERFIRTINDIIPGEIILRAKDHADFRDRSLKRLEADIIETGAHVVVIDQFYHLHYEPNTSRTTGGDAANTAGLLNQLAGYTRTVIHAITQASEDDAERNEDGNRELRPPRRSDVKKTSQLLEEATNLIGIDTLNDEGRGVIELGKGRNGGEGKRVEIMYLPKYGIVREQLTEAPTGQFTGTF
jgi:replicative DNA helicase